MPLLQIKTNVTIGPEKQAPLLAAASRQVAELLGKPEDYVMVSLATEQSMLFAGTAEPLAYLELKSIGLPQQRTRELSAALHRLVIAEMEIPANRVYIEFTDVARNLWGWNQATFAR